jgi:tetratricopeptide (TPR) repeat protein
VFDRAWATPPDVMASERSFGIWTVAPPPALFVDRDELLAIVREVAERERAAPAIIALSGLSGMGKSALLLRIAAMLRDLFDVGLAVDFGSLHHDGAVPMADVMAGLLDDMGVDPRWIPPELSGRHRRWRAVTEGRRTLLLLDGVSDAAQVLTLVPNSRHALVVAAGEVALEELWADGATVRRVPGLDADHGMELLARLCGDRVATQPEHARKLVAAVGGSPGAIRVLAGHLRSRRGPSVEALITEFDSRPMPVGSVARSSLLDSELIELFANVYNWLPRDAARLYHLLGCLPGRTMPARIIAAVYGADDEEVEPLVDLLVQGNLLDEADDEFVMPDLVRRHAQLMAAAGEDPAEVDAGVGRAMAAWLDDAVAADFAVLEERFRVGASLPSPHARAFRSKDVAMEWLARLHDDLLAVMRQAAAQQAHGIVWRLFQAMWPFYSSHMLLLQAWWEAANLAVAAARADGDTAAEARMLCLRARRSIEAGDFPAAGADLDLATQLSHAENGPLFASVLDFTGQYHYGLGRLDDALAAFEASLAINERLGDQRGIALQAQFCGRCLGRLGHGVQALAALDRAARLIAPFDDARAASRIAYSRAEVLISLGRDAEAVASLHDALDFAAGLGQTVLLARPLESLAKIAGRLRDRPTEHRYVEQVVALHRRSGSPELEQWQRRLEQLSQ